MPVAFLLAQCVGDHILFLTSFHIEESIRIHIFVVSYLVFDLNSSSQKAFLHFFPYKICHPRTKLNV